MISSLHLHNQVKIDMKLYSSDSCFFSRFDLIYLILDKADEQIDRHLAKHIVALHFENPNV